MPFVDDVNRLLRDHAGYTGDGQGGSGALPVGDRSTSRHPINKRDIRELLIQMAQTMGDPEALQDIIDQLGEKAPAAALAAEIAAREALADVVAGKADLANSGSFFTSRTAAVNAGQSNLPGTKGLIFTIEGQWIAVRVYNNGSDDPLFETQPSWGVARRLPTQTIIDALADDVAAKADLEALIDTREKILTRIGSVPTVDRDSEIVADPVSRRTIRRTRRDGRQIDGRGLALVAEPDVAVALPRIAQMRIGPLTVDRDAEIVADPVSKRTIRRTDRLGRQYGDYRTLSGSQLLSADMVAEYVSALPSFGYGLDSLWRTAELRRGIELGQDQQLVISIIGDSWTGSRGYWVEALTLHLRSHLGDAGPGWFGFAASSSGTIVQGATTDITVARTGTWTDYYGTGDSPDAGQAVSSTAGDRYTLTGPAGLSDLQLFGSSGTVRYSWDAGATWTTLELTGGALQVANLIGLPASSWTLWIEVVGGTVGLSGVNALKDDPGVRVNKLGKNGTHTRQWASINEADFDAGHAALGSDLVIIHHGTNDQWLAGAVTSTPDEYHGYVDTIVARLRAAVPTADILLSTPPSARTEGYPMSDYAAAMRRIAIARQVAHVDLQFRFGRNLDEYEFGADRELLNDTSIHPTTTGGRAVLVGAFANIIDRS